MEYILIKYKDIFRHKFERRENMEHDLADHRSLVDELKLKGIPAEFLIVLYKGSDGWNYSRVLLTVHNEDGMICYVYHRKGYEYYIQLYYEHLQFVTRDTFQTIKYEHDEPNKIWKLNHNAVKRWIEYYHPIAKKLLEKNRENRNRNTAFLEKVRSHPNHKPNPHHHQAGHITLNGLEYRYRIDSPDYIVENIELNSRCTTYEDFVRLSDNQYKKP